MPAPRRKHNKRQKPVMEKPKEKENEEAVSVAAGPSTTRKRKEEKNRKKDPRSWENIMKPLESLDDAAKLASIQEKYNELHSEFRRVNSCFMTLERQYAALQKESDHHQSELTKSTVARARLENLCREMQKQNKQMKEVSEQVSEPEVKSPNDDNSNIVKEEEERRKQLSQKFADKLTSINGMMTENRDKSEQLRDENIQMTEKLAELYNQFRVREDDINKMSQQMELERQYASATLAKMELELKAEKEIYAREQSLMQNNLEKSEANCRVLLDTVKGLQEHIDIYKGQYQDFESTMSKSNQIFDTFKNEMEAMSKQMSTLEQDSHGWRAKWQEGCATILELTEIRRSQDEAMSIAEKKIEQLQKLCRQLQVDRAAYLKLLKANGIEPTTQICVEDKPAESSQFKKNAAARMTKKEQELQILKNNLKTMQDELYRLKDIEAKSGVIPETIGIRHVVRLNPGVNQPSNANNGLNEAAALPNSTNTDYQPESTRNGREITVEDLAEALSNTIQIADTFSRDGKSPSPGAVPRSPPVFVNHNSADIAPVVTETESGDAPGSADEIASVVEIEEINASISADGNVSVVKIEQVDAFTPTEGALTVIEIEAGDIPGQADDNISAGKIEAGDTFGAAEETVSVVKIEPGEAPCLIADQVAGIQAVSLNNGEADSNN